MNCAQNVHVNAESLTVDLSDGRKISVPLGWYPRLEHANAEERVNWRLIGKGHGIHWPDLDEDISVEGLLESLGTLIRNSKISVGRGILKRDVLCLYG